MRPDARTLHLVSYYYPPLGRADGVNRAYLSRFLAEAGWSLEVLACANPAGLLRNFQRDTSLLRVIDHPRIRVHRVSTSPVKYLNELLSLAGLVQPFQEWIGPASRHGASETMPDGIVYAIVPPVANALVAASIARSTGLPLVLDFRDNEFGVPAAVIHSASALVASTRRSLDDMRRHYRVSTSLPAEVIHNGFPDETPSDAMPDPATLRTSSHELHIVYAGLANLDQDPATLARAWRLLAQRAPATARRICIDYLSPDNYYTRRVLARLCGPNVRCPGYRPYREALGRIRTADLGYSALRSPTKGYCIPSKVFQYLAMERPIIATCDDGALRELIMDTGIGFVVPQHDLDAQAQLLARLVEDRTALQSAQAAVLRERERFRMAGEAQRLDHFLRSLGSRT